MTTSIMNATIPSGDVLSTMRDEGALAQDDESALDAELAPVDAVPDPLVKAPRGRAFAFDDARVLAQADIGDHRRF